MTTEQEQDFALLEAHAEAAKIAEIRIGVYEKVLGDMEEYYLQVVTSVSRHFGEACNMIENEILSLEAVVKKVQHG